MPRNEKPHNQAILAAIAAYRGEAIGDVVQRFLSAVAEDSSAPADSAGVAAVLETVIRRVRLAPISFDTKQSVLPAVEALSADSLVVTQAEIAAWNALIREQPPSIVEIDREPVVLPPMPDAQHAAWNAILDLETDLTAPWCLIGGQMVALYCAEHNVARYRPTEDADIVMGVWTERTALKQASQVLSERGFAEDQTFDGYGYRYRRGNASVDLLLPEDISDQNTPPTTTSGRSGIEVPGGNQALMRAERVPVQLGPRTGHVRRPNMLGALVAKAAASLADNRDTDRHRDDIALLGQIALDSGLYRSMARMTSSTDRKRIRKALENMPNTHSCWKTITEPQTVLTALKRLSTSQ